MQHQHTGLDSAFDVFAEHVRKSFAACGHLPLFKTDVDDLFAIYLSGFDDPEERQHHNCSCCRQFLNRVGSLVVIEPYCGTGARSAMFAIRPEQLPEVMRKPLDLMRRAIESARVTGQFFARETVWGTPQTGEWSHFSVVPSPSILHTSRTVTPGQQMAAKLEEFDMLRRGLAEFSSKVLEQAIVLLGTAPSSVNDKFAQHARGLFDLALRVESVKNQRERDLLLWDALGTSTGGFARVRSSALGTLLADLNTGVPADQALRSFTTITDPLRYMRATVAPKAGNIKRAEDLVATLGLAPAFERRYATLDEVVEHAVWRERSTIGGALKTAQPQAPAGVFGALKSAPAGAAHLGVTASMTWAKFAKTILPMATHIELVPAVEGTFGAITGAMHADAPALFAWDNSFGWYRWTGIDPASFGVHGPTSVLAIVPVPSSWGRDTAPHPGVVLVLAGAADSCRDVAGLGLFPEILRDDLREVRSTIHAHSAQGQLVECAGQAAAGLVLRKGATHAVLRVTVGSTAADYLVGEWE